MKKTKDFQEIEHTADAAVEVWGETIVQLFQHAAQALYAIAGAKPEGKSIRTIKQVITLEAADYESLLVAFLSELLFFLDRDELFMEFQLDITDQKLKGRLQGRKVDHQLREIKAVTFHQLHIQRDAGTLHTILVFDI